MQFVTVVTIVRKKNDVIRVITVNGRADNMSESADNARTLAHHELAMLVYNTPNAKTLIELGKQHGDLDAYIAAFNQLDGYYMHRYGFSLPKLYNCV